MAVKKRRGQVNLATPAPGGSGSRVSFTSVILLKFWVRQSISCLLKKSDFFSGNKTGVLPGGYSAVSLHLTTALLLKTKQCSQTHD